MEDVGNYRYPEKQSSDSWEKQHSKSQDENDPIPTTPSEVAKSVSEFSQWSNMSKQHEDGEEELNCGTSNSDEDSESLAQSHATGESNINRENVRPGCKLHFDFSWEFGRSRRKSNSLSDESSNISPCSKPRRPRRPQHSPQSSQEVALEIMVKIRLLPAVTLLRHSFDAKAASEAAKVAQDALIWAQNNGASRALQARCCYYIGIAHYILGTRPVYDRPMLWFQRALEAEEPYDEGRRARSWINHWESTHLSPNQWRPTSIDSGFLLPPLWQAISRSDKESDSRQQQFAEQLASRDNYKSKHRAAFRSVSLAERGEVVPSFTTLSSSSERKDLKSEEGRSPPKRKSSSELHKQPTATSPNALPNGDSPNTSTSNTGDRLFVEASNFCSSPEQIFIPCDESEPQQSYPNNVHGGLVPIQGLGLSPPPPPSPDLSDSGSGLQIANITDILYGPASDKAVSGLPSFTSAEAQVSSTEQNGTELDRTRARSYPSAPPTNRKNRVTKSLDGNSWSRPSPGEPSPANKVRLGSGFEPEGNGSRSHTPRAVLPSQQRRLSID